MIPHHWLKLNNGGYSNNVIITCWSRDETKTKYTKPSYLLIAEHNMINMEFWIYLFIGHGRLLLEYLTVCIQVWHIFNNNDLKSQSKALIYLYLYNIMLFRNWIVAFVFRIFCDSFVTETYTCAENAG
jgi:hypothetical protein